MGLGQTSDCIVSSHVRQAPTTVPTQAPSTVSLTIADTAWLALITWTIVDSMLNH
jgi:hypothetical protein